MATDYISLLDMGSERSVADLAVKALEDKPDEIRYVLDLCFLEQYPLSMRAARVIQLYCEKYPESIYPFLEESVEKILKSGIDGVKRNFLKIYDEFIDINRLREPGPLLNACFDWLQNPKEKPGTRIHAMNVIYNIARQEPDLLKELSATLELVGEEGEISIMTCISKMKQKIRQTIN
jgi:hypothetical protein